MVVTLDNLMDSIPGRKSQIENLAALLSNQIIAPPNLIIHGPPNTGKSLVLRELLNSLEHPVVWKSCLEFFTPRLLFDSISIDINKIVGLGPKGPAVDSITALQSSIATLLNNVEQNLILILDDADHLLTSNFPQLTVPSLLRLSELTETNLTLILVFHKLPFRELGSFSVSSIYFPPYSKEDILQILTLCLSEETFDSSVYEDDTYLLEEVWQAYVNVVVEAYSNLTWDICELRSLALSLWPHFLEPVVQGKIEKSDWVRLYRAGTFLFSSEKYALEGIQFRSNIQGTHQLPVYGKYLLIAAYLASHNPSKLDCRIFSKSGEPRQRRKIGYRRKTSTKISQRFLGPTAFPLERLLAIFTAIIPDHVKASADIFYELSTLTTLKLIIRTSSAKDPLDGSAKWRANISWNYVSKLAKDLEFEIETFLAE